MNKRLALPLMILVGLVSTLNCGKSSSIEQGDGDGDCDGDAGGTSGDGDGDTGGTTGDGDGDGDTGGTTGSTGTGGAANSPVTNTCWYEENAECGLGGASGEGDCLVTSNIDLTCSVYGLEILPTVLPSNQPAGLQFVTRARLLIGESDEDRDLHGHLEPGGQVTLTDLGDGTAPGTNRLFVLGFDPTSTAVDLLLEDEDRILVSEPYERGDGEPTWVQALSSTPAVRAYARAPDGALHILGSRMNDADGYAVGTTADGFDESASEWTEVPAIFAFTQTSTPAGLSPSDSDRTTLVAEVPGEAALSLAQFSGDVEKLDYAEGNLDAPDALDYAVVAAGGATIRVIPSPSSGLDALDLPLAWAPVGDCPAEGCDGSCAFSGDWVSDVRAARTSDGRLWVAARIVHEDTVTEYFVQSSDDAYICGAQYSRDESTSDVILFEIDLGAGTVQEVLSLSAPGLVPTELNLQLLLGNNKGNIQLTPNGAELLLSFPVIGADYRRHTMRIVRVNTSVAQ